MAEKFEPKEDTGQLFRNDKRESEKHPEFRGEYKVRCPGCGLGILGRISAWVRESKSGNKYFSLAFSPNRKDAP